MEGIRAITPEETDHLAEWFKTIKQRGALLALAQEKVKPAAFGYQGTLNRKQIAMLAAPFAVGELTERDAAAKTRLVIFSALWGTFGALVSGIAVAMWKG